MFKRFSTNYMVLLFLIDGVVIQICFWLGMQLRFVLPFGQTVRPEFAPEYFELPGLEFYVIIGLVWPLIFLMGSVYTPRRILFWAEEFQRVIVAHTVAALTLAGIFYLGRLILLRLAYGYFFLTALAVMLGYRTLLRFYHRLHRSHSRTVTRMLVVGAGRTGQELVQKYAQQDWPGLEIVGLLRDVDDGAIFSVDNIPILGLIDEVEEVVHQHDIDTVVLALPRDAHVRLVTLVNLLQRLPVRLHVVPDYFDLAFHHATLTTLGGIPLIGLRDPAIDGIQRFCKRLIDLGLASAGLLALSPLFLAVALAIRLEDSGPIFYRAQRVGENGRLFYMLKFRSMCLNADRMQDGLARRDAEGNVIYKTSDDPRITRVGRFIRRTSIDELPQLINVFRGEMSIVGPRPELPWLVDQYEPWQRKRFAVPQGMTGWWQVNGRSDNPMHLHTDQDLYYIQNYSLWLDLQILWRTIGVVLRGKGAY